MNTQESSESSVNTSDQTLETSNQEKEEETKVERISKAYEDHIKKKGKLELLTGLLGFNALQSHRRMDEVNQEAENQWVRKNVFGYEGKGVEEDDVNPINILGDINHPYSHSQQTDSASLRHTQPIPSSPPRRGLHPLAAAALGTLIPGAGIAGVALDRFLNPREDAPPPAVETDPGDLGIGSIKDYISK